MATVTLSRLRSEALKLPEAERAELAHELVRSLDAPPDTHVAEELDQEILRRLDQVEGGNAKLLDREEFRGHMRTRLGIP